MTRAELVGAAFIVVVTGASMLSHSSGTAAQGQAGGEAIKAVSDAYVKASLAGDAKAIAELYTEDAVEMPPNQPMVKGRTAIQEFYEKMLGGGTKMTNFTLTHLDTMTMGDRAYDIGTYEQTMSAQGSATTVSDRGKYMVILKQAGSDWKVAYVIYNSDQPPPTQR